MTLPEATLLGLLGAIVGATIQHLFARALDRRRHVQELRSRAYVDFLKAVADLTFARRFQDETLEREALRNLTDAKSRISMYGKPAVIAALSAFILVGEDLAAPSGADTFMRLIAVMRKDASGYAFPRVDDLQRILLGPRLAFEAPVESPVSILKERPMPLSLSEWANLAAIVSAMADVLTVGKQAFDFYYLQRVREPDLPKKAAVLQAAFSTYSDDEVEAIKERIESCRDRFVKEGSGPHRKRCLCSVLQDVKDGNGGYIPVDDWQKTYNQLNCATA